MRKCANISPYMRRPLVVYDFATGSTLSFLIYEENLIFFFISVHPPCTLAHEHKEPYADTCGICMDPDPERWLKMVCCAPGLDG
jgi:hypothetical protein